MDKGEPMRYLIFGTGDYYERYKKWFNKDEIIALLDNSSTKQNTYIDGIKVLSPADGVQLEYDIIVILSFYVKSMKSQLLKLGVDEKCIYHFFDLHRLFDGKVIHRPIKYYGNAKEIVQDNSSYNKKVLLMSQELTLGGPPIALYHAAMILHRRGYTVIYCSMIDGPLRGKLMESDIPVIVDENLQLATMKEVDWVHSFSLIVCNTLNFHVFLSERNTSIPVIWWLHDARFFYDGVDPEVMNKISFDNLEVVSVGPIPKKAIREFLPNLSCGELLYGVEDIESNKIEKSDNNKINFITIGFLEDIKGQDILIQAIKQLLENIRHNSMFYIVGHNKTLFGEKLEKESIDMSEVCFTGSVDRDRIHEFLEHSDVLICPSRQDSMPTVAAEAMMHSVPCILSDATGTAAYIHDGEDGFIFPSENAMELAKRIEWCVRHKNELVQMGIRAREIYEKVFSMKAFETNLLEIVNRNI